MSRVSIFLAALLLASLTSACGPGIGPDPGPEATCPPVIRQALNILVVSGEDPVCDATVNVTNDEGTEPALGFAGDCANRFDSTQTASGTYSISVEADGYEDQTVSNIDVTDDGCVANTRTIEVDMVPL